MNKKILLSITTSMLLGINLHAFDLGDAAKMASQVTSSTSTATKTQAVPSNALVDMLTSQLGINDKQAAGGVGSILSYAKDALPASDYTTLAKAIPNSDSLLSLAPQASQALGALASSKGSIGGMAALASQFSSLGLGGDMVSKFVPVITDYLKGANQVDAVGILTKLFL